MWKVFGEKQRTALERMYKEMQKGKRPKREIAQIEERIKLLKLHGLE
jgi:hypothetical protein